MADKTAILHEIYLLQLTAQLPVENSRWCAVDKLKQRLLEIWQQTVFDSAINEWRDRLKACVLAKGGHFKHLM